ncbi:hypothetical protein [uncultured Reyranella sp.]|uniref:hypothetical protein n=1 Tax=uncultured Reyranella sp. TaxID=735512 RepID=UPI0025D7B751|nr:hypothetical protein [uncultured Reyranella sp.]
MATGTKSKMPRRPSAGTVQAMIDEIQRATKGRHMRWVMVDDVARRLNLDDAAVDDAIRQAEAKGLLVAEGKPPHSVCLKAAGGFGS